DLRIGDPLNGVALATGVAYRQVTSYVGVPVVANAALIFYVVENGAVLGRLVFYPTAGSYNTVTWGGEDPKFRKKDPNTGLTTLNDTTRIRIWNDDPLAGGDLTYSVPQTLRFNIINALLPPTPTHAAKDTGFID